jgi:RNA polymerase sigma-70 factor (ECF subfamily)
VDATETLAALVKAARTGQRAALEALYRRFAPVVHGILLARLQPVDADDLTQDVFETALARLSSLREDAAFPGWIASIARHAALDAARRRMPLTGIAMDDLTDGTDVEAHVEARRAMEAIRSLPEAYRETLLLRLVEGLTGQEIAERTGLAPGSVRVNLHRGMALLRAALSTPIRGAST